MCPKQVHEGRYEDHMSLSVVMIDLGKLRGQMFPRTGFAPSGPTWSLPLRRATDFIGRGLYTVLYLGFPWYT
jgi:hypothetical protein